MKLKTFITACISLFAISLPYNIIGCGGGELDPHDYFVSFFNKNLSTDKTLQPFYYTNIDFLYDGADSTNISELTSEEWLEYAGQGVNKEDAFDFICKSDLASLTEAYNHVEKGTALKNPSATNANTLFSSLKATKDLEALGYLIYAKKLEPHVTGTWSSWEPVERDSIAMARLIKNGQQLYAASKKAFIRNRFAYQIVRLAHYSKRYKDCIEWYDKMLAQETLPTVLNALCVSLKAGALKWTGKQNEAAYEFSKLFNDNKFSRLSNYMSFDWSVKRLDANNRRQCLALCKNDKERASLLGLFALGSAEEEISTLEQIYKLDPSSNLLELLSIRELHKLEEYYFSPSLVFAGGDKTASRGYESVSADDPVFQQYKKNGGRFITLLKTIGTNKAVKNQPLFTLTAAHTAMIMRDFSTAESLAKQLAKSKLSPTLADQLKMTGILITINSQDSISGNFEEKLLPSLNWLSTKAKQDPEYGMFYRRLFADVLSSKYKAMKGSNQVKHLLCTGVADKFIAGDNSDGWYFGSAIYMLRNNTSAEKVAQLIAITESKSLNSFEKYLVSNSAFTKDDLYDIAGTTLMRNFDFANAESWFKKVSGKYYEAERFKLFLAANPFADHLLDTHAPTEADTVVYTKKSFASKMIALEKISNTSSDQLEKANALYQYATGLYNMSYWGNSWLLVKYDWSGGETANEKNDVYFNVTRARDAYVKASSLFSDRNKKARAIFMAAKCDQKQAGELPGFYSFPNNREYLAALRKWTIAFDKKNGYFTTLKKEYSNTTFFTEAEKACSYLSEFVRKDKK